MTVKKNPNADSPGDFVGRGGLGAGGGRTYTGSTGGKSIVTGKKSSVSKKAKNKLKGEKKRDWSDVKLTDRKEGLTEKFLENHGYRQSDTSGKPNTYTYDGDKVKVYSAYVKGGGKSGVSVKTFNNPTLKSLRDWMGY